MTKLLDKLHNKQRHKIFAQDMESYQDKTLLPQMADEVERYRIWIEKLSTLFHTIVGSHTIDVSFPVCSTTK